MALATGSQEYHGTERDRRSEVRQVEPSLSVTERCVRNVE
jgi:hypothetical protein